jgi:hypothetical protein
MAQVQIEGDDLIVEMEGLDKLWALKSRLVIPLANVRGATADPVSRASARASARPGRTFRG